MISGSQAALLQQDTERTAARRIDSRLRSCLHSCHYLLALQNPLKSAQQPVKTTMQQPEPGTTPAQRFTDGRFDEEVKSSRVNLISRGPSNATSSILQ